MFCEALYTKYCSYCKQLNLQQEAGRVIADQNEQLKQAFQDSNTFH